MYPFIILCGGLATRLGEISVETPKCLLKLNKKPFLLYQLEYLDKNGAKDVFLSVGHLSDQFYDFTRNYTFQNINIRLVDDGSEPLGTGGAVKNIIAKLNSPSFVMYGDSFLRINFEDIYNAYDVNLGPLIVVYKNNGMYDVSNVHFDGKHVVYNKTNPSHLANYIDYGIGIYKESDFKKMGKSFDLSLVQEHFSNIKKLQHFEAKNRFYEIGTPASYKKAEKFFKNYES